ncbi:MAG TPA: radical SAM family heme chaperone HemW [Vicinamibacterales bacterium]|jgi:oxygen-independent coproporphyrinogen-3 oxidase|nr:radical SAM family heme chaperone HemW [Vicinamibacterales bacterium]
MLGLYVHIPFCSAICNYCNFNRGLFDASLKEQYVQALLREIASQGDPSTALGTGRAPADTIYFGGGTPSLLEPAEIAAIIAACRAAFAVAGDAEITMEANPETVTPERLAAFRDAGVNRLSYGVQSFRDEELQRLSRLHSASRAAEAFAMARAAGFDNVSLDLMMWLPQQTIAQWLESVDALIALGPDHASLYILELYPNAPLREAMARSKWSLAPDDDAAEMYLEAMARLDAAGYEQYEISNVARRGRESRHNLKYWADGEWLGFGCGAHSTRRGVRWKNLSSTTEYIAAVASGGQPGVEKRELSRREALEEALFTGLRLARGIDVHTVKTRYDADVWGIYGAALERFREAGLLIYDGRLLRLSRAGMLLANEIMSQFVSSPVVD